MSKPHLRLGVIAVIRRDDGLVMAFERSDLSGEWQLPQGGLERGEEPREAAWRELTEETGLGSAEVELVDEYDGWTAYLWPAQMRRGERYGQAHRWFFFRPIVEPLVPRPDGSEFRDWRWMRVEELIAGTVDFRKQPYRQVLGG